MRYCANDGKSIWRHFCSLNTTKIHQRTLYHTSFSFITDNYIRNTCCTCMHFAMMHHSVRSSTSKWNKWHRLGKCEIVNELIALKHSIQAQPLWKGIWQCTFFVHQSYYQSTSSIIIVSKRQLISILILIFISQLKRISIRLIWMKCPQLNQTYISITIQAKCDHCEIPWKKSLE